MAARYWVGGTDTWNATAGTKWAATSGGPGGETVPTSADDVYFDAASTGTCTVSSAICKNITFAGFTGTLAGSGSFSIYGSLTISAGMTWTNTSLLGFSATSGSFTVTTAGKTVGACAFGTAIATTTWTLGDALTSSGTITVTGGTFDTNNYNVTASSLSSSNSNTRTINLGSSTVSLSSSSFDAINFTNATNLTFNAGTSQINITGTNGGLVGGGQTFYNVSFTSTTASSGRAISGTNTFNNLAVTAPASAGVTQITFDSRQTINGTLSTTGTAGNRRVWFRGVTYGIAQTLTVNATPSLTDADFRDIYVIGTAAPISGTRIGDLRGCRGITFSTPKTVYWVTAAGGNWSANNWAASSGGGASTDNFPLAQDTAVIENTGLNTSATVTLDSAVTYFGTIDMSTRTNAMTLAGSTAYTVYGNWVLGSGVTQSYSAALTFSGRNTQTITSAGKTLSGAITVDSYGGSVELADALNIGTNTLTVTNGTFDTKNYNVTAGTLSSSNSNVRTITLGSSTVTLSSTPVTFTTSTNFTFNAGTSMLSCSGTTITFNGGGQTFYDVEFTNTGATVKTVAGVNTFRNLTFAAPSSAAIQQRIFSDNQTITGTLTVAGATAVRRGFLTSSVLGTQRNLTVGTLSADDCDFRDITIAGTAAGGSPTRAGDCGGNSGITFPAPKTVYWNLAGTQNWSATAWAPSSGGTPDINNFPLAQDTAVFDDTGSAGTITSSGNWNIGTVDMSARTSAMTFSIVSSIYSPVIYKDFKIGTGITMGGASVGTYVFSGRGTQTITSNGIAFGTNNAITIDCATGTVQLADALTLNSARTLTLTSGTFDAVSYNVTTGLFSNIVATGSTLRMGSGTWTLSGTGNVWNYASNTLFKGTANIVLSDTSTTARTFTGGAHSYNKLTIGGATGTSTLTITGNNQFTELASTKTVAHTIALGTTTQTFGKWTVTGTSGNVVTLTGTGTSHILAGSCTDSIDYLAMGSIGFASTSPGEFYAGANSTGTAGAPVYRTAKPADSTRYWVGGTGNWNDTNRWSTTSGGAGGADLPRSHDDVVFDSSSNATAYTATVNAITGGNRCKSLTIAGPGSGNVTLAGSTALYIHDDITLPATGLTRTYTGAITLTGSTSGKTLTTNGVALESTITVNGVGCEWALGSALDNGPSNLNITNGSFDLASYNLTIVNINCTSQNSVTLSLSTSSITTSGTLNFSGTGLTLNAGTSTISNNRGNSAHVINGGSGLTFYNYSVTATNPSNVTVNGANTFNNFTVVGKTSAGVTPISFDANQTINGTLTLSAGTNATMRHFVQSNTFGTTRTLTCNAVSMTDVDFRDITIAGAAAPASGTRIGDCKGNSGITFTAAANKYWNLAGGGNWSATGWATSSGGTPDVNDFPLAQDTCIFEATGLNSGATVTVNAAYNIGTIDMSARTTNTMTLATGSTTPSIYGNWINGTGTTLTGTGTLGFSGRGSQTITSAGVTFTQSFTINTPGGSVTLQDAFSTNRNAASTLLVRYGTFDANGYNVTLTGSISQVSAAATTTTRQLSIGSGTWTIAGSNGFSVTSTNLTVTGTGTISLTSASAKTFTGDGVTYTNITLDQGGAGTLTITGNNTFKDITNTYKATGATAIAMGTTTQRVSQWTAAGESGRVLTVQGTSASSPATLIFTGSGTAANVDYLTITGVRAYDLTTTWYAGANSTNNGSLGWYFDSGVVAIFASFEDTATGSDQFSATVSFAASFQDTVTASDQINALAVFLTAVSDTSTASDSITSNFLYVSSFSDSAVASDSISATPTYSQFISESTTASDVISTTGVFGATVNETVTTIDSASVSVVFVSAFQDTSTGLDEFSRTVLFVSVVTESSTITDSAASLVTFASRFADTASGTDSTLIAASTFNAPFSDSATITDTNIGFITFPTAIDESATATDSDVGFLILPTAIAESASGTDTTSSVQTFAVTIQEQSAALDSVLVAPSVFNAPFQDTVQAIDVFRSNTVFPVSIAEQIAMTDTVIGGYLWSPVDDNQGAVWQDVSTIQSPGWTDVNDSQTPGWTPVLP